MLATVRIDVPADVTPIRHDGTRALDARGVSYRDLVPLVGLRDRRWWRSAGGLEQSKALRERSLGLHQWERGASGQRTSGVPALAGGLARGAVEPSVTGHASGRPIRDASFRCIGLELGVPGSGSAPGRCAARGSSIGTVRRRHAASTRIDAPESPGRPVLFWRRGRLAPSPSPGRSSRGTDLSLAGPCWSHRPHAADVCAGSATSDVADHRCSWLAVCNRHFSVRRSPAHPRTSRP